MLSQFTKEGKYDALGDLQKFPSDVYPIGRLDADSEGLLILSNDKKLNTLLLDPKYQHQRTYWAQVDGQVSQEAIDMLRQGVEINVDGKMYFTQKCEARMIPEPDFLPERNPPVRFRKNIPTSWIELKLKEGKNRQVRKMCAKIGFPTLRLVRMAIENVKLPEYISGKVWEIDGLLLYKNLKIKLPNEKPKF